MIDETPRATHFHRLYCALTGLDLKLMMRQIFAWNAFCAHGFTEDDLKLVIPHLKAKIRAKQKWPSAILFTNIIENIDNFNQELSEARSKARAPKPLQGADVRQATGRPTQAPTAPARSAAEVIRDTEAFKAFQALKTTL